MTRTYAVVALALACVCIVLLAGFHIRQTQEMEMGQAVREVQTGDVVLFRNARASLLERAVSPFSHVGIIVCMPGKTIAPHILEIQDSSQTEKGGVTLRPFQQRVSAFTLVEKGEVSLSFLVGDRPPPDPTPLLKTMPALMNIQYTFEGTGRHYAKCGLGRARTGTDPARGMYCVEFAAYCLRILGVVRADGGIRCLWGLGDLPLQPGYAYAEPIRLNTSN